MTKVPGWKRMAVGVAAVAAVGTGFFAAKNGKVNFVLPSYEVARVIDGDTFVTKEDQYIRLASTYAPELEYCGGEEAKKELERLVVGKKVYLKVIFKDMFGRLVSKVYTPDGYVNYKMIAGGNAYYLHKGTENAQELKEIYQVAKEQKKGIFSDACSQSENKLRSKCVIKGNILQRTGSKQYRFPGCGQYGNTDVQLYLGDRWFCSEKEAIEAGFAKGSDCFEKKY